MTTGTLGNVGTLRAFLTLDANQYVSALKGATAVTKEQVSQQAEQFRKLHNDLGLSALSMMAIVIPMRQFMSVSQKAFGEFDHLNKKIQTITGRTAESIERMTNSLSKFGKGLGYGPIAMNKSAYVAAQAAFTGYAQIQELTKQSVKMAKASGGEISSEKATELSASILHSFGLGVEKAEELNDVLLKTRDISRMTMEQLGKSIQKSSSLFGNFSKGRWKEGLVAMMTVQSVATQAGTPGNVVDTGIRSLIMKTIGESLKKGSPLNKLVQGKGYSDAYTMLSTDFMGYLKTIKEFTKGDPKLLGALGFGFREITVLAEVLVRKWHEVEGSYNEIISSQGTVNNYIDIMSQEWDHVKDKMTAAYELLKVSWGKELTDLLRPLAVAATDLITFLDELPSGTKKVVILTGAFMSLATTLKTIVSLVSVLRFRFLGDLLGGGASGISGGFGSSGVKMSKDYSYTRRWLDPIISNAGAKSAMSMAAALASLAGTPYFPPATQGTPRSQALLSAYYPPNYSNSFRDLRYKYYGAPRLTGGMGMGVSASRYVDPILFNMHRTSALSTGLNNIQIAIAMERMARRNTGGGQTGIWGGAGLVNQKALSQSISNFMNTGFVWQRRLFNPQATPTALPPYIPPSVSDGQWFHPSMGRMVAQGRPSPSSVGFPLLNFGSFTGTRPFIPVGGAGLSGNMPFGFGRGASMGGGGFLNFLSSLGSAGKTLPGGFSYKDPTGIIMSALPGIARFSGAIGVATAKVGLLSGVIYGVSTAIQARLKEGNPEQNGEKDVLLEPNASTSRMWRGLKGGAQLGGELLTTAFWNIPKALINGSGTAGGLYGALSKSWGRMGNIVGADEVADVRSKSYSREDLYFENYVEAMTKELVGTNGSLDAVAKKTILEGLTKEKHRFTLSKVNPQSGKYELWDVVRSLTDKTALAKFPQLQIPKDKGGDVPVNPMAQAIATAQEEADQKVKDIEAEILRNKLEPTPHRRIKEYADALQLGTAESWNARLPQYKTADEAAREERRQNTILLQEQLKSAKEAATTLNVIAGVIQQNPATGSSVLEPGL